MSESRSGCITPSLSWWPSPPAFRPASFHALREVSVKRPAFQFYPGDWLRSTDLRSCSIGARGLWIDMLCLMHEGTPYGYLKVGNKDILPPILAKMVGESTENVEIWLKELENSGVFSRKPTENGSIYSRRMVRDEKVRESRASGGIKSLENPNVPRPRISLPVSLDPSPASAFAFASASSRSKTKTNTVAKANGNHVELPDWIPLEHWTSFLAMRTKIRKPATARAQRMLIGKLSELKDQGYNPMQVIAQAELNCWKSFFPPKDKQ